jgi:hypothetical protein
VLNIVCFQLGESSGQVIYNTLESVGRAGQQALHFCKMLQHVKCNGKLAVGTGPGVQMVQLGNVSPEQSFP